MSPMDPADCLRSLTAEALARAHPDRPLFPVSLRLMAVANALVMLGLLPEPQAEAILAEHRRALEGKGLGNGWGVTRGELTVRPGAGRAGTPCWLTGGAVARTSGRPGSGLQSIAGWRYGCRWSTPPP
jgi:hypothetical protein